MVQRGEIHWVDLQGAKGSEQQKRRPGVILQNNVGNKHSPVTIVATCTSSKSHPEYPVEVLLPSNSEDVDKDTIVQLNQIRTVDINKRLHGKIGEVTPPKMRQIEKALKISFGLRPPS